MPIYAYRCASCGHARDVLQKISDAPLTVCPACGSQTFAKQVTAAGFQLKGTGWYATDFSGHKAPAGDAPAADAPASAPAADAPATDAAKTEAAKPQPAAGAGAAGSAAAA